ncbi:MAG: hypothetical protein F2877_06355 [Actinobacteria bacterium]|nr:hypothetical protein [Actinomycetota bacterium]
MMHIRVDIDALKRGRTELGELCKRHHLQKTHDGYRLERKEESPLNGAKGTPWRWRPPPNTS